MQVRQKCHRQFIRENLITWNKYVVLLLWLPAQEIWDVTDRRHIDNK